MTKPLTVRVDDEQAEKLEMIARATDRSVHWLCQQAVARFVDDEFVFLEGVRRGIEDADAGRVVPQEEVKAGFEAILQKHNA
jgi:predicted transcriptional regulator